MFVQGDDELTFLYIKRSLLTNVWSTRVRLKLVDDRKSKPHITVNIERNMFTDIISLVLILKVFLTN